jgi:hypothetical protein
LGPLFKGESGRAGAGAGLRPESYLQPNRKFVQVSLRIHFDFFDYASVLFLHPEVFTEHGRRPGRHGHRERATGYPGGTATRLALMGQRWTAQGRAASMGDGGHGQAALCSDSGNGHWAGYGTEVGSRRFGRVGRAGVTEDFGPLSYRN